jgi:hypothetical protein
VWQTLTKKAQHKTGRTAYLQDGSRCVVHMPADLGQRMLARGAIDKMISAGRLFMKCGQLICPS